MTGLISLYSKRYQALMAQLEAACDKLQRPLPSLVIATKTQSAEHIRALYEATGLVDMGENYLEEAALKRQALEDLPLVWHYIGAVQSRACPKLAEHFDWLHSLSRAKEVLKLSNAREALSKPPLKVCLQVNISGEHSKHGLPADAALLADLWQQSLKSPGLCPKGVMILPQMGDLGAFERIQSLAEAMVSALPQPPRSVVFSMGTSGDYLQALAGGSTLLRLGTALFGPRKKA